MIKDLIVLVPDKNTKSSLDEILLRHKSLKVKRIEYDIFVHPLRDPGVYNNAVEFLREFINQYNYALVFFDHEGSGQEAKSAADIVIEIKTKLERNGWLNKSEVIVFDPELEIWAWVDSSYTANAIGWADYFTLKKFIIQKGLWQSNSPKPDRPKEALECALREKTVPRSSSIYQEIAERADFSKCTEPSFLKFIDILHHWFSN